MYLVTNHIDRDTFNRVQQEIARRSGKQKNNYATREIFRQVCLV